MSRTRKYSQDFSGDSLTQQGFKDSCDVNNIVRHYESTGFDPYESRKQQIRFGHATSKTFSEAMQQVAEVQSAFAALPATVRHSFQNDPQQWIDHLSIPEPTPAQENPVTGSTEPPAESRANVESEG